MTVLGLYDEFDVEVVCPNCKRAVLVGFQTKALLNLLLHFKVGDKVETKKLVIKDGIIKDAIGACPKCQSLLSGKIVIKGNVFQCVQNIRIEQRIKKKP